MHRLRLILVGLVLAALALGCPHVSVVVPNAATPGQASPPVPPRTLGTGGADPFAWYANERAAKFFYVTDPTMAGVGAKGDNVTDDTAAIVAADAAAKAVLGTVVFPPPAVCYKTTAEIGIHWAAHWLGYSQNINQATLCAHGSGLRSVVELRSTFGEGAGTTPGFLDNAPTRALLEDLTIDAGSGAARTGLLLDGAEYSRLRNLHIINATENALRNASVILPPTISGVTVGGTGGSPTTGMSFTQSDPNYLLGTIFSIDNGAATPTTAVVKISAPGALGTATYQLSLNGNPFSTLTWPLASVFQLANSDASNTQAGTGILGHFPAGTYVSGTTYSVTITPTDADINQAQASNDSVIYDTLVLAQSGTTYATTPLLGNYGGFTFTATAAGTVSTTSGSQIVVGSGTSFLTGMQGCQYGRGVLRVGGIFYGIGVVLDDTHLALIDSPVPSSTASGLDYAMSCNAGYYEDGANESDYTQWIAGEIGQVSIGMDFGYQRGMLVQRVHVNSSALAGLVLGGPVDDFITGFLLQGVHTASGTFGSHGVPYIVSPHTSGQMNEPEGLVVVAGNPVNWFIREGGLDGPLSNSAGPVSSGNALTFTPQAYVQYTQSTQAITSAGQSLTLPDVAPLSSLGHTAYINLTGSADFTFTGAIVPDPHVAGVVLVLRNASLGSVYTFPNWLIAGTIETQGEYESLGSNETMTLISTGESSPAWVEKARLSAYANSNLHGISIGNTGESRTKLVTSNNTPTILYTHFCSSSFGGAGGLDFDVMANQGASPGTNVGSWEHCFLGLDVACNITAYTCDIQTGTNGGLPPAGWAVTHDASGTNPMHVYATGDASGAAVRWVFRGWHRDGANF